MQDNNGYTIAQHTISHALLSMAYATKFLMRTLEMFGHRRSSHADMTSLCLIADELDKISDRHGLGKSTGADLGSEAPVPAGDQDNNPVQDNTPAPANPNEPSTPDSFFGPVQPESESTNNAEDQS